MNYVDFYGYSAVMIPDFGGGTIKPDGTFGGFGASNNFAKGKAKPQENSGKGKIDDSSGSTDDESNSGGSTGKGRKYETTEEIRKRKTKGSDGSTSQIRKIKDKNGKTIGVIHEVIDKNGKIDHRDWKGPGSNIYR